MTSVPRPSPSVAVRRRAVRGGVAVDGQRQVPEETAVALSYNRVGHAVMMATPADLDDFAVGFSLTEGIIERAGEISRIRQVRRKAGIVLEIAIAGARADAFDRRRRHMAGPVGCGLCGIESLDEAVRSPRRVVSDVAVPAAAIPAAVAAMAAAQALNDSTHAVHAAAFCRADGGLVALREDVGRHNALDKLAGALARSGEDATAGIVVVSSRLSVEMVQKTAAIGCPVLVAVSAPTALAIRTAEAAGMTLIGVARGDEFEIFTRPERVEAGRMSGAA